MYTTDSFTHVDCFLANGPGERNAICGICLEAKTADEETGMHSKCKNSFHTPCFENWSKSCRSQFLNATCPGCRAVLVNVDEGDDGGDFEIQDTEDGEDESADFFRNGVV